MVDRSTTLVAGHYEYDAGARVLYIVKDNQVLRWNVTTGAYMTPFTFVGPLSDVAVSSDSRYLVVGASDTTTVNGVNVGTLYRLDILTGVTTTIHYDLAFYELGVTQVEITSTNEVLFTTDFGGSGWTPFRRFDLTATNPTPVTVADPDDVRNRSSLTSSPDGSHIVILEHDTSNAPVLLYNAATQAIVGRTDLYRANNGGFNIDRADVTNDGRVVVTTYSSLIVYDASLRIVRDFSSRQINEKITDAHFSSDGRFLTLLNRTTSRIEVLETTNWTQVGSVPIGGAIPYVGLGSDIGQMNLIDGDGFAAITAPDGLRLIDLSSRTVVTHTGTDGNDELRGLNWGDLLQGGAGDDQLFGGGGDDVLNGGLGSDTLNGGLGIDTADYFGATVGVTVNLAAGQASGGAGADTLTGIENLTGSSSNDALTGDDSDNVLRGMDGGDLLNGRGGNDILDGGAGDDALFGDDGDDLLIGGAGDDGLFGGSGIDTADYSGAPLGVAVDLARTSTLGVAWGGHGSDRISGVENVNGSGFADLLVGDGNANVLRGNGGIDTLRGGGGNDTLIAGAGGVAHINKDQTRANGTIGSAVSLDKAFILGANAAIADATTVPHASVTAFSHGDAEYYAFTVSEGATVTFDIDGASFNSTLRLLDAAGIQLSHNDNAAIDDDNGFTTDSTLTYTFGAAGTYYVQVAMWGGLVAGGGFASFAPPPGSFYTLHVSIPGHAVTTRVMGSSLYGEDGDDILTGGDAADLLVGGSGSDTITGGAGIDRALYNGLYQGYAQTSGGFNGMTVRGGIEGGTDTVSGVETVQFLDGALSFQTDTWQSVVYRMYDAAFDRGPDPFGMVTWTDALAGGMNLRVLSDTFEASAEFQTRYGALNNTNFIKEMYRFSLNREADAPGLAHWEGLMAGGMTRAEVLYHFSESIEHKNVMTTRILAEGMWIQDENTISIARLYDSILDKLPDVAGLRAYRYQMDAGATLLQVAQALMGQPEYQAVYGGLSNQLFVEKLYQVILNRAGDSGGIASWTAQLDGGLSRAELLVSFSQSIEHAVAYQRTWNTQVRTLENGLYPASSPDHDGALQAEVLPAHHDGQAGDGGFTAEVLPGVSAHDKGGFVAEVSLPAEVLPGALDPVDAWNAHIVRAVGNTAAFDGLDGDVSVPAQAEIAAEVLPAVSDDGFIAEVLPGVVDDGLVAEVLPGAPNETVAAPFDRTGGVMLTEDAFVLADAAPLVDIPTEVLPGVTDEIPPTAPSALAWLHGGDTARFDSIDDIATLIDAADYRPHTSHPDQLFG